jgi:hypothetical protein
MNALHFGLAMMNARYALALAGDPVDRHRMAIKLVRAELLHSDDVLMSLRPVIVHVLQDWLTGLFSLPFHGASGAEETAEALCRLQQLFPSLEAPVGDPITLRFRLRRWLAAADLLATLALHAKYGRVTRPSASA